MYMYLYEKRVEVPVIQKQLTRNFQAELFYTASCFQSSRMNVLCKGADLFVLSHRCQILSPHARHNWLQLDTMMREQVTLLIYIN